MITITLPWPDRRLSPNARLHHMALARVKKAARHDAWVEGIAATSPAQRAAYKHAGRLNVAVTFTPPNRQRRDLDGCISSCKAMFDGISDALGVDDSRWRMTFELAPGGVNKAGVLVEIVAIYLHDDTEAPRIGEPGGATNANPGSDRNRLIGASE